VASRNSARARGFSPLGVLLRRPLLVGMAALATVALLTLGLALVVVTVIGPRVDRTNDMLAALQDGHIAMINQETGLRGFLVTREPTFLEPYWKGVEDLRRADATLRTLGKAEPDLADHFAELDAAEQDFIQGWARPTLTSQPAIGDTVALNRLLRQDKRLFDQYRTVETAARALVEDRRGMASAQRTVVVLSGALVALLVAVAVAVAVRRANRRLAEQLVPPIRQVRDTLAALADGQIDRRAVAAGPEELRDIADDVNALGDALQERDALVAAREEDLVSARDEAERAGHAKTAFLATMSHEIRTPLNAVLGLTDLLLTTELTEEQRGHLDTVSRSGDSLLMLINDILDFSKIEAGELDLERAPFDLSGLVYDVAQLLAPQAAGKGLDLLVDIHGDGSWQVVGDGARLRQVVINLVGNAVKFTATGQVVLTVDGEITGSRGRCRISVTDTGIGIPVGQHHRLFRSFSQVDASTTRSYGGTGLGLAISQRIANAMGGDITVVSAEGEGSTFTLSVDLEVAPTSGPEGPTDTLAGRRLLIVDDNPTNLRILEHQLNRYGAVCTQAQSGAEALEVVAAEGPFDACLLDLHMPGMDGDEVAGRLRKLPDGAELPLILLSSSSAVQANRSVHFAARLHKPVRPERLERTVRSVLGTGAEIIRTERRATPRTAGVAPAQRRGETRRRLRVLVAEDHAVNAQLMKLYLEQLGHDSDHVANGELAVDAVRSGEYDVVLMDAQMPILGGGDATAAIRCMPGPQPRIVAVTASVLAADRAAFLEAGADDFLTKPVRLATLDEALSQWEKEPPVFVPAVPAVAPDTGSALDAETVEELRDLGDDAFRQLYGKYSDSLATIVDAIGSAAEAGRWSEEDEHSVPRLAHKLKGGSAALGALDLADLCRRLQEAPDGVAPDVVAALAELDGEARRVGTAVEALLAVPR
jgi:signal transduction histidine kinase/CheY-like chemotaxis protein